jgi:hypothetical protein
MILYFYIFSLIEIAWNSGKFKLLTTNLCKFKLIRKSLLGRTWLYTPAFTRQPISGFIVQEKLKFIGESHY